MRHSAPFRSRRSENKTAGTQIQTRSSLPPATYPIDHFDAAFASLFMADRFSFTGLARFVSSRDRNL